MLYGAVVRMRNWLYNRKLKPSTGFDLPVIVIGNLSAGGTGKTPMAEYVLGLLLENGFNPALLSRGYGRKTKGLHWVKPYSTADMVGDEPYQIKRKLQEAVVAVCENRVEGIQQILKNFPETDVIVLDDALQHRRLKPGFSILLTDYGRPYYKDALLPEGMLREPASGRRRADVIIMTKCPQYPDENERNLLRTLLKPELHQPVYFTSLGYSHLVSIKPGSQIEVPFPLEQLRGYKILLVTGIANPKPLLDFLRKLGLQTEHMAFPDHYNFKANDMLKILSRWERMSVPNKLMLTTEKDWRRLEGTEAVSALEGLPLYFLPVEVLWNPAEKLSFDQEILNYVSKNKRSR